MIVCFSRSQSQFSIDKAVSTLGMEAMRAAQTAVVIGEDNRRAREKEAAAEEDRRLYSMFTGQDRVPSDADVDETVIDGSLNDDSDSSARVTHSSAEQPKRRKNSAGASAVKVRKPRVALHRG